MSVSSRLPRAAFVLAIVVTLLTSSIAFADGGREGLGNVQAHLRDHAREPQPIDRHR